MDYSSSGLGVDPWASPSRQAGIRSPPFITPSSHSAEHETLWSSSDSIEPNRAVLGDRDQEDSSEPHEETHSSSSAAEPQTEGWSNQEDAPDRGRTNEPQPKSQNQPQSSSTSRAGKKTPAAIQVSKSSAFSSSTATAHQGPSPSHTKHTEDILTATIVGLDRPEKTNPVIRFDVYTNMTPQFRTTSFPKVSRTRDEFVKLYKHLVSAKPEAFVPTVPPPVTSAGAGTDEDELRIKAAFQRWLNLVFSHPALRPDEEIVYFVENNFGYSPAASVKAPVEGVARKWQKQMATPPDDSGLAAVRPLVKQFHLETQTCSQELNHVAKLRRSIGSAQVNFGSAFITMGESESHPGLSNAYMKLGQALKTVGDIHAAQATTESTCLGDPLLYHSEDAYNLKETLTNRNFLLRDFLTVQKARQEANTKADLLRHSVDVRRRDVDSVLNSLKWAQERETALSEQVAKVTAGLQADKDEWFSRTTIELKSALRDYANRHVEAERSRLAILETVRAPIRAIDDSGGLSRLGREGHQVYVRSGHSQGPTGDAWSGLPRRSDDAAVSSRAGPVNSAFGSPGVFPSRSGSLKGGPGGRWPGREGADGDEDGGAEGSGSGSRRNTVTVARGGDGGSDGKSGSRLDARNAAALLGTVLV